MDGSGGPFSKKKTIFHTFCIDFEPVGRRGDCPEGATLLDCARQLGVGLVNLCGGTGSCGRCIVQVLEGDVSEPVPDEGEILSPEQVAMGYRLACQAVPMGDCKVRVPPESLTAPQRLQVEGEENRCLPSRWSRPTFPGGAFCS